MWSINIYSELTITRLRDTPTNYIYIEYFYDIVATTNYITLLTTKIFLKTERFSTPPATVIWLQTVIYHVHAIENPLLTAYH